VREKRITDSTALVGRDAGATVAAEEVETAMGEDFADEDDEGPAREEGGGVGDAGER
jgi:hypothetical protein